MPAAIEYRLGNALDLDQVIELYRASTLGDRRPVEDREAMAAMLRHANLVVTAWDENLPVGIARTLTARYCKDGGEILIDQGAGRNPRTLTPREAARLMGFPDGFAVDVVSRTQMYRLLGNAVVPQVVEAIGHAVIRTINRK